MFENIRKLECKSCDNNEVYYSPETVSIRSKVYSVVQCTNCENTWHVVAKLPENMGREELEELLKAKSNLVMSGGFGKGIIDLTDDFRQIGEARGIELDKVMSNLNLSDEIEKQRNE